LAILIWPQPLDLRGFTCQSRISGKVFAHCYGGKGRSGMVLLRLMVERGLDPDQALQDLRRVRPGAVETQAQWLWAISPG